MRPSAYTAIICSAILTLACDDDGDGGFGNALSDPAAGQINGPLQGQVLMDGKLVDLPSGVVRVAVPKYNDGDIPVVTLAANGSEFIEIKQLCDFDDGVFIDCLIFRDAQGTESSRFLMGNWELQNKLPQLSPNGQLLAVLAMNDQSLLIIDRGGNVIDHSRQRIANAAWAPDGALVYTSGQSIYRVAAAQLTNQAADTRIQSFDESAGNPLHLSVSPDGERIAFSLSTENTYSSYRGTVWTMNSNGSNSQLFAHSASGFASRVGWPQWSPDGQWILVQQENLLAHEGPGTPGSHTALRSDRTGYELGTESEIQIKLRATCFRRPDCREPVVDILSPNPITWVAAFSR